MQRWRVVGLSVLVALGLGWVFYNLPSGADWHYAFYPTIQNYLHGKTILYDGASPWWYNPPWILPLLLPLGLLSETTSMLLLRLIALVAFGWGAICLSGLKGSRLALLAPILASVLVWDTIIAGNIDFLVLLGIVFMWKGVNEKAPLSAGLGFMLALTKPHLALLPALALLPELRSWSWAARGKLLLVPALASIVSLLIAGPDWPLRLLRDLSHLDPLMVGERNVSLTHALGLLAQEVGLPDGSGAPIALMLGAALLIYSWSESDLATRLAIGIVLGAVVSSYASSGSLSLLVVGAWPRLLQRGEYRVAALAYVAQYIVLARAFAGYGAGVLLVGFVLVLLCGLMIPRAPGVQVAQSPAQ